MCAARTPLPCLPRWPRERILASRPSAGPRKRTATPHASAEAPAVRPCADLAKPGARPYCSAQPLQISLPPFEEWAPPALAHHAPKLDETFWTEHGPKPHCVIRSPHAPIVWAPRARA